VPSETSNGDKSVPSETSNGDKSVPSETSNGDNEMKTNGENKNQRENNSWGNYLKEYKIFKCKLSNITKEIHHRIRKKGRYMFDYSPITLGNLELPLFFRVVINSQAINENFLDGLVEEIEQIGGEVVEWFVENGWESEWEDDEHEKVIQWTVGQ
ncbi:17990_t:CDS:1, partial [Acaulospora morrowiae]